MSDLITMRFVEIPREIIWKRNCPNCGKKLTYSSQGNLKLAIEANSVCRSCAMCGFNNHQFGKHPIRNPHTKETIEKIRLNTIGKHIVSDETRNKLSIARRKRKVTLETRKKISVFGSKRYENKEERHKTSDFTKKAWKDPVKRKRMLDRCKWNNISADKGQLEMIACWNKMGFNLIPNYQLKTDTFLCYIDGYDKERNVVLEYDGRYHNTRKQMAKDLVRQQKIIDVLKPKKFWRYNATNKQCKNALLQ